VRSPSPLVIFRAIGVAHKIVEARCSQRLREIFTRKNADLDWRSEPKVLIVAAGRLIVEIDVEELAAPKCLALHRA